MALSNKDDSEYNAGSEEYSENENIHFQSKILRESMQQQNKDIESNLANFKKSAEMWSIQQITEEIDTLTEQMSKLKKSKEKSSPYKGSKNEDNSPFRSVRKRSRKNVFCFCNGKYSLSAPMVQCDSCDIWYHQICVGLTQDKCDKLDNFYCDECKEEKLKELDRKNFQKEKKIFRIGENGHNFISKVKKNREYYHSSKKEFLTLFEGNKKLLRFCIKVIDFPESQIRSKIKKYEKKLEDLKKKSKIHVRKEKSKSLTRDLYNDSPRFSDCKSDSELLTKTNKIRLNKSDMKKYSKSSNQTKTQTEKCIHDQLLINKVKILMEKYKLSQKMVSKDSKLIGGSTTLSSWLNNNYVYNVEEKEEQLRKWYDRFTLTNALDKKPIRKISLKQKEKPGKIEKNEKIDKTEKIENPQRREKISKPGNKKEESRRKDRPKKIEKKKKFQKREKVDFLYKKNWIEGIVLKATRGQYLIKFKFKGQTKEKWIASMAKRVFPAFSKRKKLLKKSNKVKKKQ